MKLKNSLLMILCLIMVLSGCSKRIGVHGKVTFPDGQPLTKGAVVFQNDKVMVQGDIQPDGTYSLGMLKNGDGCDPGQYQVFITGAVNVDIPPAREKASDPYIDVKTTTLIDKKMTLPETSGLSCSVEKGMQLPYDITVNKPK